MLWPFCCAQLGMQQSDEILLNVSKRVPGYLIDMYSFQQFVPLYCNIHIHNNITSMSKVRSEYKNQKSADDADRFNACPSAISHQGRPHCMHSCAFITSIFALH